MCTHRSASTLVWSVAGAYCVARKPKSIIGQVSKLIVIFISEMD